MVAGGGGKHVETIRIPARFNGPPTSGNGGYVCGLLGSCLGGAAEVTLHVPPPLERSLSVVQHHDRVELCDGDTLIAEGTTAAVDLTPPARVRLEDAERAVAGYRGFVAHAFPTCVVCGPDREVGDGLRLFPGPVEGTPVVAAPWVPAEDLAGVDGRVASPIVWAALDCPSYFGGPVGVLALLGRLAVDIRRPVLAGEPHVVLGWGRGSERRKHYAAAAVMDVHGEVLAVSRATWIALPDPRAGR